MRRFISCTLTLAALTFGVGCASEHHDTHAHPERETYLERHAPQPSPSPARALPPQLVVIVQQPPPDCAAVVREAPPRYFQQERGPRPSKSHVWVDGYWVRGREGWVWVSGRWEKPPRNQALWVTPHWERQGDEYRFKEGHWH